MQPYYSDSKGYMAMKTRLLLGILLVAGIVASNGLVANASIVLSCTFNDDGEARLVSMESALAQAIRLSIQGGDGLFAVLAGDEVADDGSRLPVLRVRPVNASTADTAIASEAYLTFSFQTGDKSELGLRTLEFNVSKTGQSAEFGCLVQSSLDGFGSGHPVLSANRVAAENSDKIHYSVDLSGDRFQDLSGLDFRVYFYSSESDEPLEFDGIQLKGEVHVAPEPTGAIIWLLLTTVALCVAGWWGLRQGAVRLAYAPAGLSGTTVFMTGRNHGSESRRPRQPWTDEVRAAVLDIVDRGRIG